MNEPLIAVRDLHHAYKKQQALRGVTFAVERGSIHGFVGPNGAGKTTTLKVLATLLKPQQGTVRVFGLDIVAAYRQVRRRIGFMPDHFSMYRQMTVQEYLDFFAAAYGLAAAARTKVIGDVLALTDLEARRHDLIKALSRGMQQRVSLARVLVHDPELLLLDEPASGLDPRARVELMEILRELRRLGKTIFISSHILSELALLCDSVTILDRGEVKYCGLMSGLARRDGAVCDYLLVLAADHPPTEAAVRQLAGVTQVTKTNGEPRYRVSFQHEQTDPNKILSAALANGAAIVAFQEDARALNQAFLDLTEPGGATPTPIMSTALLALFERSLRLDARRLGTLMSRLALLGIILFSLVEIQITAQFAFSGAPGLHLFKSVMWINVMFLSLVGLSYFASAITEEKEEMMLGLLRMTDLNAVSILLGKSTSRLVGAGLLVLVQFPFTLLAVTLGGVTMGQVTAAYATLLAYTFLLCNVALFASVLCRRTTWAATLTAGFIWVAFVLPDWVLGMLRQTQAMLRMTAPATGAKRTLIAALELATRTSAFARLGDVLRTGFREGPVGVQVVSNLLLGVGFFLLAWAIFEPCTRNEHEEAPARGLLLGRKSRAGRVPPHIHGLATVTWKDMRFGGGGWFGHITKFAVFGLVIGVFILAMNSFRPAGSNPISREDFAGSLITISLAATGVLLAVDASRIFKHEVRWQTLSALLSLPYSVAEIAYRKVLAALIGVVPFLVYFVVGLWLVPKEVADFFHSLATEKNAFEALLLGIGQYLLFLHLVAYLSLVIKRGALPLAVAIHYVGAMFIAGFFAIVFRGGPHDDPLILAICGTAVAIGLLHWAIGRRLVRTAAEE